MTAVLSTAQDAFFDVLKTVPLLLLVYALLYYIENRLTDTPALLSRTAQFGTGGRRAGRQHSAVRLFRRCERTVFRRLISPRQRSSQCFSRPRMRPYP